MTMQDLGGTTPASDGQLPAATPAHVGARDRGFSYVEVVVTIVLMGVLVVPILAAVRTSIRGATVSRAAAELETVLVNAADVVHRADLVAEQCDLTSEAQQAAITQGWAATAVEVEHFYLQSDGSWSLEFDPATDDCPLAATSARPNGPVVLVRITVTSPDEDVTRSLEVVKSAF